MTASSLLDQLIEASGLAEAFARQAIERALKRANIVPTDCNKRDVRAALPELERTLKMYLGDKTPEALRRIDALIR